MDIFRAMEVSASGLAVERTRMNVASANLANAETTRGVDGGPYKRKDVVVQARPTAEGSAVFEAHVAEVAEDQRAPRLEHDPGHPDADAQGMVALPNVNVVEEIVDMITATRAYEAGVTAMKSATAMADSALGIGR
jgi:flagellar basal-body rod protein FlgC